MSFQGYINEVFSSVQGEGPWVGMRQLFIRLAGCNLSCNYCDTLREYRPQNWRVEWTPGSGVFESLQNPSGVQKLADRINRFDLNRHHGISLTGGEPLLQADFLKQLIPLLGETRRGVYLETNGTLHRELEKIIDLVDIIAMDIKLPGSSGAVQLWEAHSEFIKVAVTKRVFVKIVVDNGTSPHEIKQSASLISEINDKIKLVLQPVTINGCCGVDTRKLYELQDVAMGLLRDVRVIPQTHVMMSML